MTSLEEQTIAIVGGGNMGEALLRGLLRTEVVSGSALRVSEIIPERRKYLEETYPVAVFEDSGAAIAGAHVIILAVKPQSMRGVLEGLRHSVKRDQLVVSIAAGTPISLLESFLEKGVPVVRVMPNAGALVLEGAAAVAAGQAAGPGHVQVVQEIFSAVGETVVVGEASMDAVTGLSGSGPAYVFVIIEALADGGVLKGLSRDVAQLLAVQTVLGAAKMLLESGKHPAQLKDMVASPGGTTAAGLRALETGGIRGILMDAVAAATERSIELGRG